MKTQINLPVVPNGIGSFDLDDIPFDFTFRTLKGGSLVCDIAIDGNTVAAGRQCVNLSPLLLSTPFKSGVGNLYFMDKYGNENPRYEDFNRRFALVYDDEYKFEGE